MDANVIPNIKFLAKVKGIKRDVEPNIINGEWTEERTVFFTQPGDDYLLSRLHGDFGWKILEVNNFEKFSEMRSLGKMASALIEKTQDEPARSKKTS